MGCVVFKNSHAGDNFIVGNIYRPPHRHIDELNTFINEFSDILEIHIVLRS